jgi:hypothetical protein
MEETPTRKQKLYAQKKDDAEFMRKNREYRMAYYYRNREKEQKQSLARYYAKKEALKAVA